MLHRFVQTEELLPVLGISSTGAQSRDLANEVELWVPKIDNEDDARQHNLIGVPSPNPYLVRKRIIEDHTFTLIPFTKLVSDADP